MIPKVEFKKLSLEENIELVKHFYFLDDYDDSLDVYKCVVECFPEIGLIDSNLSNDEKSKKIEAIVKNKYFSSLSIIDSDVSRYNKIWSKYNDSYVKTLSDYLGVYWPDIDIVEAKVGILPLAPRDINEFNFDLNIGIDDNLVVDIVAHELCHFLWFVKWKKLFPDCDSIFFNSPYLPWKYSEMVIDPILNSKSIKDVLGVDVFAYDSFYKIYDGDRLVMDKLNNIFNDESMSIEDKIIKGYEYVSKIFVQKNYTK